MTAVIGEKVVVGSVVVVVGVVVDVCVVVSAIKHIKNVQNDPKRRLLQYLTYFI